MFHLKIHVFFKLRYLIKYDGFKKTSKKESLFFHEESKNIYFTSQIKNVEIVHQNSTQNT